MNLFAEKYRKEKVVLDLNKNEKQAIINARKYVGEWLQEKGTSNLDDLSSEEKYDLMIIIYGNVCNELAKIESEKNG